MDSFNKEDMTFRISDGSFFLEKLLLRKAFHFRREKSKVKGKISQVENDTDWNIYPVKSERPKAKEVLQRFAHFIGLK